jgi:xylitol oxidase
VTAGAGVTYGQLAPYLDSHGFAVHNLASLPHVSVAGACATATHGSGSKNGNLATVVAAMEMVTADGEIVKIPRERAVAVHLGGLGVVTSVTLDVIPAFQMRQMVYENLSFDHLEHHLEEIFSSGYSVSLFTDWQNHQATQVWIKSRVEGAAFAPKLEFFGAKPAKVKLHPLAGHSAENCTEQLGIPGPWYERMPHFRMNFTPSSGDELQSEFFVPREKGYQAILAIERLREHVVPHRCGPVVDESLLPAAVASDPLHLETSVAGSEGCLAADRRAAGCLQRASTLGQTVHHGSGAPAGAICAAERF